jgi:ubiquinone/menaquinone biosynthesis C-methylase UbiE
MTQCSQTTDTVLQVAPYFDVLLKRLDEGDARATVAFGRHVHWGWWSEPERADGSPQDYAAAAERLCRKVCDAAGVRDGMSILDVGCGFGGTIASLNERFCGLNLVGVNIDKRQLERAAQSVHAANGNRIRWVEADACKLPFAAGSFDVVLAVECIFHFPSRDSFLGEAAKVLVPGGRFALSDFVPPADALPTLQQHPPGQDEATRLSYGKVDLLCPVEKYHALAIKNGLEPLGVDNISIGTLPTYAYLRTDQRGWSDRAAARTHEKATTRLEMACRMDLLHYTILSFARIAAAARQAS